MIYPTLIASPVSGLGIGAEIGKKDITVILDVTGDYSNHNMLQLIARTVTWLIKQYYYNEFGTTLSSEEILKERLIYAIDYYSDTNAYVDEYSIAISLIPGYEETTLRVTFTIHDAVKFINRTIETIGRTNQVKDTYLVNLKWRSFKSPIMLSSKYHESFKEILLAMGLYYLKNLLVNSTLSALYNLIIHYSAEFIKTVVEHLKSSDIQDLFYSKIVRHFEEFIRVHNMGYLVDAIRNITTVIYDFVMQLKSYPIVSDLIDEIINAGIYGLSLIETLWNIVVDNLGFLIPAAITEFINNFGESMYIASLALSLIGMHFNINSTHIPYLANIIIDVARYFDNVSYLLDHPAELTRAHYLLTTKDGIKKLLGDYLGSMLLDMSGFSKPLKKWKIIHDENRTYLYFAMPVYPVPILGELLIIDPVAKIYLPDTIYSSTIHCENDTVTYIIRGAMKDYPYEEKIPNLWLWNNIAIIILIITPGIIYKATNKKQSRQQMFKGIRSI